METKVEKITACYAGNKGKMSKGELDMFCWGRVVAVHHIGDHEIVEYFERVHASTVSDHRQFYVTSVSAVCETLDQALIVAVASKYDGNNSQAPRLFCKALGII